MQDNKTIKSLMLCYNELFTDDTIGDAGTAARLEAMDEESLLALAEETEVDSDQLVLAMNHAMPTAAIIKLIMDAIRVNEIQDTLRPLMWNRTLMEFAAPGNNFSDAAFMALSENLCGNDKLVILDLSHNLLSAHCVNALVEMLSGCPSLRDLDLAHNRIGSRTCSVQSCQWCKAPMTYVGTAILSSAVKRLNIGHNHLGDNGTIDFMTACIGNRNLNSLILSGNGINSRGAWAIAAHLGPEVCTDGPPLVDLDLSLNNLCDVIYSTSIAGGGGGSNNARRDNGFEITARQLEPVLGNAIKGVRYRDAKSHRKGGKKGKKAKKKGGKKKKKGSIYRPEELQHRREHEEHVTAFTDAGWANACRQMKDPNFKPPQAWVAAAFLRSFGLCEAFQVLAVEDSKFSQGALAALSQRLLQKRIFALRKDLAQEEAEEEHENDGSDDGDFRSSGFIGRPPANGRSEEDMDEEEQEFARILAKDMIAIICRERTVKSSLIYFTEPAQRMVQQQRMAGKQRAEDMDDARIWQALLGMKEEDLEGTREWITDTLEDLILGEEEEDAYENEPTSPHVLSQPKKKSPRAERLRRLQDAEHAVMSLRHKNMVRPHHPEQLMGQLTTA
eukprot:COSAG05_NODE_1256_length_5360_cov_7.466831_4_plen_615_part_00